MTQIQFEEQENNGIYQKPEEHHRGKSVSFLRQLGKRIFITVLGTILYYVHGAKERLQISSIHRCHSGGKQ